MKKKVKNIKSFEKLSDILIGKASQNMIFLSQSENVN